MHLVWRKNDTSPWIDLSRLCTLDEESIDGQHIALGAFITAAVDRGPWTIPRPRSQYPCMKRDWAEYLGEPLDATTSRVE
ncbi:hypothetical protein [Arthrobacter monumenti]